MVNTNYTLSTPNNLPVPKAICPSICDVRAFALRVYTHLALYTLLCGAHGQCRSPSPDHLDRWIFGSHAHRFVPSASQIQHTDQLHSLAETHSFLGLMIPSKVATMCSPSCVVGPCLVMTTYAGIPVLLYLVCPSTRFNGGVQFIDFSADRMCIIMAATSYGLDLTKSCFPKHRSPTCARKGIATLQ